MPGLELIGFAGLSIPTGGSALLDGSEADGTNRITDSTWLNFSAGWGVLGATLTANNAVAPDGATTAARLLESVDDARHGLYIADPGMIVAGNAHTYSIYVKSITRRYFVLMVAGGGGAKVYVYFDLQTGAVTDSGTVAPSGGTAVVSSSIAEAVNGFYKCSMRAIVDGTSDGPFVQPMLSNVATYGAPLDSNSPQYAGNTAQGAYLWRPKVVV